MKSFVREFNFVESLHQEADDEEIKDKDDDAHNHLPGESQMKNLIKKKKEERRKEEILLGYFQQKKMGISGSPRSGKTLDTTAMRGT